jgi:hypothetical protein
MGRVWRAIGPKSRLCWAIGGCAAALLPGCAAKQTVPLECVSEEVVVYVDGRLLEERPDALELRADEPHKLFFKLPGHEPQLVVLESAPDDEGRLRLSPADVCVELVPVGLARELTIEVEGDTLEGSPESGGP